METLREKLEKASASMSGMEQQRAQLQEQVEAREEEIERLGKQIGSGSNLEKVRELKSEIIRYEASRFEASRYDAMRCDTSFVMKP